MKTALYPKARGRITNGGAYHTRRGGRIEGRTMAPERSADAGLRPAMAQIANDSVYGCAKPPRPMGMARAFTMRCPS